MLETRIGIISTEQYATSFWQVGMMGNVRWVIAPNDLPARCDNDPPWHRSLDACRDRDVQVIVLQGQCDESIIKVWLLKSVEVVIHISVQ